MIYIFEHGRPHANLHHQDSSFSPARAELILEVHCLRARSAAEVEYKTWQTYHRQELDIQFPSFLSVRKYNIDVVIPHRHMHISAHLPIAIPASIDKRGDVLPNTARLALVEAHDGAIALAVLAERDLAAEVFGVGLAAGAVRLGAAAGVVVRVGHVEHAVVGHGAAVAGLADGRVRCRAVGLSAKRVVFDGAGGSRRGERDDRGDGKKSLHFDARER